MDDDSLLFLVSKKLSQLIKLITHLDFTIAEEIEHENYMGMLVSQELWSIRTKACGIYNNLSETVSNLRTNADNTNKILLHKQSSDLRNNFESSIVSIQSEMTEFEAMIKRRIRNMKVGLLNITSMIDEQSRNLGRVFDNNIQDMCNNRSKKYEDHLKDVAEVEIQLGDKMQALQEQTQIQFHELDNEFAKTLAGLKQSFKKIGSVNLFENQFTHFQVPVKNVDIVRMEKDIEKIVSSIKISIYNLKNRCNDIINSYQSEYGRYKVQLNEIVSAEGCFENSILMGYESLKKIQQIQYQSYLNSLSGIITSIDEYLSQLPDTDHASNISLIYSHNSIDSECIDSINYFFEEEIRKRKEEYFNIQNNMRKEIELRLNRYEYFLQLKLEYDSLLNDLKSIIKKHDGIFQSMLPNIDNNHFSNIKTKYFCELVEMKEQDQLIIKMQENLFEQEYREKQELVFLRKNRVLDEIRKNATNFKDMEIILSEYKKLMNELTLEYSCIQIPNQNILIDNPITIDIIKSNIYQERNELYEQYENIFNEEKRRHEGVLMLQKNRNLSLQTIDFPKTNLSNLDDTIYDLEILLKERIDLYEIFEYQEQLNSAKIESELLYSNLINEYDRKIESIKSVTNHYQLIESSNEIELKQEYLLKDMKNEIDVINDEILKYQKLLSNERETLNKKESEESERFQKKIKSTILSYEEQIHQYRSIKMDELTALDNTIEQFAKKIEYNKAKLSQIEVSPLERLENSLKIRSNQLNNATLDLKTYKVQLVKQEDTYNSRFGFPQTIAVPRPQTTQSVKRPFTAAPGKRPLLLYSQK